MNKKPVFHYGIQTTRDLCFDLNNIDSYTLVGLGIESILQGFHMIAVAKQIPS